MGGKGGDLDFADACGAWGGGAVHHKLVALSRWEMKRFIFRTTWTLPDYFALVCSLALALWLAIPSSLFIKPTAVVIDGYTVKVWRSFPVSPPLKRPIIAYVETVRSKETGEVCSDNNSRGFRYDKDQGGFGVWNIEEWAAPCMTDNYHWSATWYVKAFGVIPLRPVELDLLVTSD